MWLEVEAEDEEGAGAGREGKDRFFALNKSTTPTPSDDSDGKRKSGVNKGRAARSLLRSSHVASDEVRVIRRLD